MPVENTKVNIMNDVVCFGELLIDFVALESGATVGEASGFEKAPGGAPANVAVAISRLGHKTAFLGQVGDDPFGHFLADVLDAEGINISGLRFSDKARTMLAFVALGADGERSFNFYRHPSADMLMTPNDVAIEVIESAKIFHFGSITLISEPSRSATLKAAQYARDEGVIISYDPNLRLALWDNADSARAGMMLGMEYAQIIKISEEELRFLTGGDDVSGLWGEHTRVILVTSGDKGSTAYVHENDEIKSVHHAGYKITPIDTTGAGDGFMAGVLSYILEHPDDYSQNLAEMLCFANGVGALTTTNRGAIPALPSRAQVEAFITC